MYTYRKHTKDKVKANILKTYKRIQSKTYRKHTKDNKACLMTAEIVVAEPEIRREVLVRMYLG